MRSQNPAPRPRSACMSRALPLWDARQSSARAHLLHDALGGGRHAIFYVGGEPAGEGREAEGFTAFVAAFFPDAQRRDIAEYVVRVACDPGCVRTVLSFELERVVDG